jgi:hypothetical protein
LRKARAATRAEGRAGREARKAVQGILEMRAEAVRKQETAGGG